MQQACYRAIMAGAILLAVVPILLAEVTGQINYQARLLDADGRRVNDTVTLAFKLYDAVTDGKELWSETHEGVVVLDGIYSLGLGSTTPIPASVFTQDGIYLELAINNETMAPRQLITSAGQALVARTVMGPDIFVNQANGKVGIGTTTPMEQLDVAGTIKATGFKLPTGATANYVLASDASGVGTWQPYSVVVIEHDPLHTNWVQVVYTPAINGIWGAINTEATTRVNADTALQGNIDTAFNTLNTNKLNIAGGVMTGPLTNTGGFFGNYFAGDGAGLTNIPISGLVYTGFVRTVGDTMTGPLVLNGGFTNKSTTTFTPGTEQSLTNGGSVGVTGLTYVKIRGNTDPVTELGNPPIAPGAAGQVIILQGNDSSNTVTFTNSTGLILAGAVPFTMGSNDIMQLVCDGTTWVEVYRCDK